MDADAIRTRKRRVRRFGVASSAALSGFGGASIGAGLGGLPTSGVWWPGVVLGSMTLVVAAMLAWKTHDSPPLPTFYYLRCLFPGMKDYYNSEWRNRSVMFLGGDVTESIIDDTIDVTARVRSDARDLQVTLGSAIEGERTLAPNLLWSMAVAVGAQFEVTGHLWLEEIVDQSKKKPIRWLLSEVSPANAPEIPVHFESRSAVGAHLIVADLADVGRTASPDMDVVATGCGMGGRVVGGRRRAG